ncbi:MAG: hypothetical protein IPL36_04150 [Nigerium sp.]|nr:hypothetical protein [Nigerium sp.]
MINNSTFDEGVEAAFLVAGAFGDRDPVEQFPGRQVEDLAVLLAGLVRQGAGDVGLPGSGGSLQDDVLAFEQVGADSQPSDQFAVDAAAGHGLEVGQIGSGLRQACLPGGAGAACCRAVSRIPSRRPV